MNEDQQSLDRLPPHNLEAEAACLGAAIMDPEALDLVLERLSEETFFKGSHRLVYRACRHLVMRNEPVDTVSLMDHLSNQGQLESVGGAVALSGLVEKVASVTNVEAYIRIVADKARLRALLVVAVTMTADVYQRPEEASLVIDAAENAVLEVGKVHGSNDTKPLESVIFDTIRHIEAMGKHEGVSGLATGFKELDDYTTGLHPGQMVVVAGRPGSGKTAFALNVAAHVAFKLKKPVAIFSIEMLNEELAMRLLSSEGRVDGMAIRRGRLRPEEQGRLTRAAAEFYSVKDRLFINDTSDLNIQTLKASVRRLVKQQKVELVVVDYLQLLSTDLRVENRVQEVTAISKALKAMAKEMRVPVLVVSQLNRGVESRQGSKSESMPRLSDLRESGSIEQDADVVMLLHRKKKDADDMSDSPDNTAKLILAKQRSGPTGEIDLLFHGEYTRFEDPVTPKFISGGPTPTQGRDYIK